VLVDTTGLRDEVAKHIRKNAFELKEDAELYIALKARLTKKELKMLLGWCRNESVETLKNRLKLDASRYEALRASIVKKLNSEKIKQEMVTLRHKNEK
jgi:hypothetical protein